MIDIRVRHEHKIQYRVNTKVIDEAVDLLISFIVMVAKLAAVVDISKFPTNAAGRMETGWAR